MAVYIYVKYKIILHKHFHIIIVSILIILISGACNTEKLSIYVQATEMDEIEIEVLRPAVHNYPLHIYNILLLVNPGISNSLKLSKIEEYNRYKKDTELEFKDLALFFNNINLVINDAPKYKIINDSIVIY